MATITEQIRQKALEILDGTPEGLRYSELIQSILDSNGLFKKNTVAGSVWNLDQTCPNQV